MTKACQRRFSSLTRRTGLRPGTLQPTRRLFASMSVRNSTYLNQPAEFGKSPKPFIWLHPPPSGTLWGELRLRVPNSDLQFSGLPDFKILVNCVNFCGTQIFELAIRLGLSQSYRFCCPCFS